MADPLSLEQIEELRAISTPTISNAIETFEVRPRNEGFMNPEIKCILPELGPMVGYAATGTYMADLPAGEELKGKDQELWKHVQSIPAPRIVVVQDIDETPCVGSMWGEVNGTVFTALGCAGTITNGGVRDLDEVRAMGFHFFASCVIPSHAYVHTVDVGKPVTIHRPVESVAKYMPTENEFDVTERTALVPGYTEVAQIKSARAPAYEYPSPVVASSQSYEFPWRKVLFWSWIAISLILSLRLAFVFAMGVGMLGRVVPNDGTRIREAIRTAAAKLGITQQVRIYTNDRVRSPIIWCWSAKPTLLVPRSAGADDGIDWVSILCHELAHYKRRDHIAGLFAEMAVCILPLRCFEELSAADDELQSGMNCSQE